MKEEEVYTKMEEAKVIIVGAGPSGLATSACLNTLSVPNLILEKEDCCASLWKKKAYDRLKLHLAKEFCHLPHMPFPSNAPTYVPKDEFVSYIDNYASHFNLNPKYCRSVESASYDAVAKKWKISAKNSLSLVTEVYIADFLVVATGENSEGFIPDFPGLAGFLGESIHSSEYKSGSKYNYKDVLVVGSGNSGMEIAYDLSNHGARTSIVIKSPVHVLTKEMVRLGMRLLKYLPVSLVDNLIVKIANFYYGDLSKHGLVRPAGGPFYLKAKTGRSPVLDVGTAKKIANRDIRVLPAVSRVEKNFVIFANGEMRKFDALIFATSYRSTANYWLKDYDSLLGDEGMPKGELPNHWKGLHGLYCVGFARRGLAGVSMDAEAVANDIKLALRENC